MALGTGFVVFGLAASALAVHSMLVLGRPWGAAGAVWILIAMANYDIPTDQFELYEQSVHYAQMKDRDDLSAPTCNDCHGNHKIVHLTDEMLFHEPSPGEGASAGCMLCHADADDPALAVSTTVHSSLTALDAHIAEAEATLGDAGRKGMPVSDAEYLLTGARAALVEARVQVHRFAAEPVKKAAGTGEKAAEAALSMGKSAIEAYFFRHRRLGLSLIGIAFVILSLVLKVRQVDRRWRARQQEPPSA